MNEVPMWYCTSCEHWSFPARRRCPACGASTLKRETPAAVGSVEVATVIRKAAGVAAGEVRHLCTVQHELGPMLLARSDASLSAGQRVALECRSNGAIWARPLSVESAA